MPYLIVCRDGEDTNLLRSEHLPAHRDYVDQHAEQLLLSGPLIEDEGETRTGQLFVLDVPNKRAAEKFVQQDPFTTAGIFAQISIERIATRFQQGSRVLGRHDTAE